jgi:hypothetical protein
MPDEPRPKLKPERRRSNVQLNAADSRLQGANCPIFPPVMTFGAVLAWSPRMLGGSAYRRSSNERVQAVPTFSTYSVDIIRSMN